jgi:hypothetical protein
MSGVPEWQEGKLRFVLGVGAQKAGTTWVYKYLANHPEASMSEWKEYGFWDSYLLGTTQRRDSYHSRLKLLGERYDNLAGSFSADGLARQRKGLTSSLGLMSNPESYAPYFENIARQSRANLLVGDITPSYCRLSADEFKVVKDTLETVEFEVLPIFILRDPLQRIVSSYRMLLRRAKLREPDSGSIEPFDDFMVSHATKARTQYQETVKSLDAIFGPQRVFYAPFENLFTNRTIGQLCDFLSIEFEPPNFSHKVNSSTVPFAPTSSQGEKILTEYQETYAYCYERFPEWNLESLWSSEENLRRDE